MPDTSENLITLHYTNIWGNNPKTYLWHKGPIDKLPVEFRVLEFPPSTSRSNWVYATAGMSKLESPDPIELFIRSRIQDHTLIELLTSITYYHNNTNRLNLNHTLNFGRSWQINSKCDYGYISLPYIEGPTLETFEVNHKVLRCLWLIPIYQAEAEYKKLHGYDALESIFDLGLEYDNPDRKSLVQDLPR